jgi:peptidoglycan/LPS O-acetylase OafA/YrhL
MVLLASQSHLMNLRALDGLRGIAALYVVLHHAFGLLWRGVTPDDMMSGGGLGLVLLSFGQQAVLLFFLISGFCIHYRQARTGAVRINLADFAWRRLKRLYPPLLLALLITAVLDNLGMLIDPAMYNAPGGHWPGQLSVGASYTWSTLIANLLFQARLMGPELGSNGPLWSLAFEFWFYLLYPALLLVIRRIGGVRAMALVWMLSWTSWVLLQGFNIWMLDVLGHWAVWVTGALIAEAYVRGARPVLVRVLGPMAPAVLLAMVFLSPPGGQHQRFPDLLWGAVLGLGLAYALLNAETLVSRVFERVCRACGQLGEISYSLYLVHYPLLALISAWWLTYQGALPIGLELSALGTVLAIAFGWLAWYAVERAVAQRRSTVHQTRPAGTRLATIPASASVGAAGIGPWIDLQTAATSTRNGKWVR